MDPQDGIHVRVCRRQRRCRGPALLAEANIDDGADPGLARPRQGRLAVSGESAVIEMGVRVDQYRRLTSQTPFTFYPHLTRTDGLRVSRRDRVRAHDR